jgi:ADP-ribose pyrophosphatase YjhB (NUDIX family)
MSLRAWTSCPVCRAPLAHEELHVRCDACGFVQYENPAATTLALVLDGRELLLVRRAQAPRAGLWDTIGGFVDPGETAEEGVRREVREEIGCEVAGLVPIGTFTSVYGETGRRTLGIAFACRLVGDGRLRLSAENDAARWFGLDDLPELAFEDGDAAVAALAADWDAVAARLG